MSSDLPDMPRLPTRESPGSRKAARQRALSLDVIVDTALKIIDTDGLDGLTMRSLAHALGTGAASLYAHVPSKERLLELVVEKVIGEVHFSGDPDPERWMDQLKEMGRQMRQTFSAHRDLARASFARIPLGENALRGSEWMIGVMRAGGLPDPVIGLACDLLPLYVMAVAYEDSLFGVEGLTLDEIMEFVGRMRDYFASLPPDRFPGIVSLADDLTAGDDNTRFEFGLEVVLRGLASMAAEGGSGPRSGYPR